MKVVDVDSLMVEDGERETLLEQMKYVSPKILSDAVVTISTIAKAENNDAVSVAKASLVPAHHPCIGKTCFL